MNLPTSLSSLHLWRTIITTPITLWTTADMGGIILLGKTNRKCFLFVFHHCFSNMYYLHIHTGWGMMDMRRYDCYEEHDLNMLVKLFSRIESLFFSSELPLRPRLGVLPKILSFERRLSSREYTSNRLYWESYQPNVPNHIPLGTIPPPTVFYPDLFSNTCINGLDYPDWMNSDIVYQRWVYT